MCLYINMYWPQVKKYQQHRQVKVQVQVNESSLIKITQKLPIQNAINYS
jgi:hypothetical protein